MYADIWTTPLLATYITIAVISLILSIWVAISIYKFGANTLTTKLVLYLHISQIIQDVCAIPYIFSWNHTICAIAGWAHIYSGMSNIMCVAIMIIAYRHMFFEDKYKTSAFCSKYCASLVFGFPLVSLIPFASNSYGRIHNDLCSFNGAGTDIDYLFQGGFYLWSCVVFLSCVVVMYLTVSEVYRTDKELGSKLMKSIVLYAFATLVFWVPRFVFQAIEEDDYNVIISAYFLIFAAGMVYSLIFYQEKSSMKLFEQHAANDARNTLESNHDNDSIVSSGDFNFSFDEGSPYDNEGNRSSISRNTTSTPTSKKASTSTMFRESAIINMRNNPTQKPTNSRLQTMSADKINATPGGSTQSPRDLEASVVTNPIQHEMDTDRESFPPGGVL